MFIWPRENRYVDVLQLFIKFCWNDFNGKKNVNLKKNGIQKTNKNEIAIDVVPRC